MTVYLLLPGGKPTGVLCGESSAPLRRGGNLTTNHSGDAPATVSRRNDKRFLVASRRGLCRSEKLIVSKWPFLLFDAGMWIFGCLTIQFRSDSWGHDSILNPFSIQRDSQINWLLIQKSILCTRCSCGFEADLYRVMVLNYHISNQCHISWLQWWNQNSHSSTITLLAW